MVDPTPGLMVGAKEYLADVERECRRMYGDAGWAKLSIDARTAALICIGFQGLMQKDLHPPESDMGSLVKGIGLAFVGMTAKMDHRDRLACLMEFGRVVATGANRIGEP